eukprot:scaffold63513_cov41-Phaeocystis_antarctica.AAC.2
MCRASRLLSPGYHIILSVMCELTRLALGSGERRSGTGPWGRLALSHHPRDYPLHRAYTLARTYSAPPSAGARRVAKAAVARVMVVRVVAVLPPP